MRLFALACFAVAIFYAYTAVEVMRTGIATPLRGNTEVQYRRENPGPNYRNCLVARWLLCGGFIILGVAMRMCARKFEEFDAKS